MKKKLHDISRGKRLISNLSRSLSMFKKDLILEKFENIFVCLKAAKSSPKVNILRVQIRKWLQNQLRMVLSSQKEIAINCVKFA